MGSMVGPPKIGAVGQRRARTHDDVRAVHEEVSDDGRDGERVRVDCQRHPPVVPRMGADPGLSHCVVGEVDLPDAP